MLSTEALPPSSVDILGSQQHQFRTGPVDNSSVSKFSIRDYVFDIRSSRSIENHWPFSPKNLHLCLNRGVKVVLPPFQCLDSVKNSPDANPSGSDNINHVMSMSEKQEKIVSNPQKQVKNSRLIEKLTDTADQELLAMASKVCPVCKTFSSSSNTTLNAHIDQCLAHEPDTENSKAIKRGMKPRKTRSMADIYATSVCCTLEELDRRNGTNWAAMDQVSADETKDNRDNGAVYFDSNGTKLRILSKTVAFIAKDDHGPGKLVKKNKKHLVHRYKVLSLKQTSTDELGMTEQRVGSEISGEHQSQSMNKATKKLRSKALEQLRPRKSEGSHDHRGKNVEQLKKDSPSVKRIMHARPDNSGALETKKRRLRRLSGSDNMAVNAVQMLESSGKFLRDKAKALKTRRRVFSDSGEDDSCNGLDAETRNQSECYPSTNLSAEKALDYSRAEPEFEEKFCDDNLGRGLDASDTPMGSYFLDVITIPGPPGSFLPSPGHTGSEDLRGSSSSDSPVSATSFASNSVAEQSSGAMQHGKLDESAYQDVLPCCCSRKTGVTQNGSDYRQLMTSISEIACEANNELYRSHLRAENKPIRAAEAVIATYESPSLSTSGSVLRLMGKNLTVVNKDEKQPNINPNGIEQNTHRSSLHSILQTGMPMDFSSSDVSSMHAPPSVPRMAAQRLSGELNPFYRPGFPIYGESHQMLGREWMKTS